MHDGLSALHVYHFLYTGQTMPCGTISCATHKADNAQGVVSLMCTHSFPSFDTQAIRMHDDLSALMCAHRRSVWPDVPTQFSEF